MKDQTLENKLTISGSQLLNSSKRRKTMELIKRIYEVSDLPEVFLSLHFVTDKEIKKINHQWRGEKKSTDVLSFSAQDDNESSGFDFILGDIVISVDTAKHQAKELGHKLSEEIAALFVHGLMHLLGLDHERDSESAVQQVECEMALLDRADLSPLLALTMRRF